MAILPIDGPISVHDVANTLGHPVSYDVGTLCKHPNINRWSKRKPIDSAFLFDIPESTWQILNYGINIKSYANISDVLSAYALGEEVWEYKRPTGGSTSPYRLGDFRGYISNAVPPVAAPFVSGQASNVSGQNNILSAGVFVNANPKSEEIGWEDLNLNGRCLVLALTQGGTIIRTAVAPSPLSTIVEMDVRDPTVIPSGSYLAFVMLSNSLGLTNNNVAGLYGAPGRGFPVEITSNQVTVSVEAMWQKLSPEKIDIKVRCRNTTGSSVSLLNCALRVRNSVNACDSTIQLHEKFRNLGTLTAPTGMNIIHAETITTSREMFPSWKVCWRNTGAYPNTFEANIIQEMD